MSPVTEGYLSRRTWLEAAAAAGVALVLSLVVFGPILGSLSGPLGGGDMLATYVNAENWGGFGYSTSTHFGFPLGMNLNYSPNIDITENAFAGLVNVVSGSPFLGINLMLFLSFPLVAALAYLLMRLVSRGGPIAIALAVAFTFIPFHLGRGLGHTYLATLYGAMTGLALALVICLGVLPDSLRKGTRHRTISIVLLAALVISTAWSGLYYATFGIILGAAALVWRLVQGDPWRRLVAYAIPVASIGVLAIIGFIPGAIALLGNPPDSPLSERTAYESVTFAGSLALALLPAPLSRLPFLAPYNEFAGRAATGAPPYENTALTNYGTWITTACLVVFVVGWLVRARRGTVGDRPLALLAYLTAVVVAFFVPWGLNFLFADVVTPQVRAWNRLLPLLLLLFCLGAMAVVAGTRWDAMSRWAVALSVVILGIVVVEQLVPFRSAYRQGAEDGQGMWTAAQEYASAVNAAIPQQCGVLQLPYVVYPEQGTIEQLDDYQHFWQPLANPDKDFSYGAVKYTDASEPLAGLGNQQSRQQIAELKRMGFCAIHLDRRGFTDKAWTWLTNNMVQDFGAPVAQGYEGNWQAYRLP